MTGKRSRSAARVSCHPGAGALRRVPAAAASIARARPQGVAHLPCLGRAQGRAVYTEGLGLAAGYIQAHLRDWGVAPRGDAGGYLQTVGSRASRRRADSTVTVQVGGEHAYLQGRRRRHLSEERRRETDPHPRSGRIRRLRSRCAGCELLRFAGKDFAWRRRGLSRRDRPQRRRCARHTAGSSAGAAATLTDQMKRAGDHRPGPGGCRRRPSRAPTRRPRARLHDHPARSTRRSRPP